MTRKNERERGAILLMSLVLVVTLVGMTAVFMTRTLYEHNLSNDQADSLEALFNAYGKIAKAEALLNRAWYDPVTGRNLVLAEAIAADPMLIAGTTVLVEPVGDPNTSIFFNLVAEDSVGRITRTVKTLMTEKESFADYNYFVNSHPLGISGSSVPRGSIHTNRVLEFYFPNGVFNDPVTASEGFAYQAGATVANTTFLGPTNDAAGSIDDLLEIDIPAMMTQAVYSESDGTLDNLVFIEGNLVRIVKKTKAGWYEVPNYVNQQVQTGEQPVTNNWDEPIYVTEAYTEIQDINELQSYTYAVDEPIWGTESYIWTETVPVYENQAVQKTRDVPVYLTRTVTKTRLDVVWVPDDDPNAVGGTAIAGGDGGAGPGHWEQVEVTYQESETYLDHYVTETYTVTEPVWVRDDLVQHTGTRTVQVGTQTVTKTGTHLVKIGEETVDKTRQVIDHYEPRSETVMQPIYETVTVQSGTKWEWQPAVIVDEAVVDANGIIYLEGDVIALEGELNGRVTIATHGNVNITGSLVYVDDEGDTSYLNGADPNLPYDPNDAYDGGSVLGVIAEGNILYTNDVPTNLELNGSFLAKSGRIGITGIALDSAGEASLDSAGGSYIKTSIRRLGGVISNLRPVATYIDSNYMVQAGFLRGVSVYDRKLQFRPPVGFPGRRRPKKLSSVSKEVVR